MSEVMPASCFRASASLVYRRLDDEIVLCNRDSGEFFRLSGRRVDIFIELLAGVSILEISELISARFEIDMPESIAEIHSTLQPLLIAGVLLHREHRTEVR